MIEERRRGVGRTASPVARDKDGMNSVALGYGRMSQLDQAWPEPDEDKRALATRAVRRLMTAEEGAAELEVLMALGLIPDPYAEAREERERAEAAERREAARKRGVEKSVAARKGRKLKPRPRGIG